MKKKSKSKNWKKLKLNKNMMKLVLFGSLVWGIIGLTNLNLVKEILKKLNISNIERIIYIVVGLSALFLFKRDTILPFLGESVMPHYLLNEKYPINYVIEKKINIPPNTKVIYWAAETNKNVIENPWKAYLNYENSGVTNSDSKGNAILKVRKPAAYKKPNKNIIILPHIHYRYFISPGMMSNVKTIYL